MQRQWLAWTFAVRHPHSNVLRPASPRLAMARSFASYNKPEWIPTPANGDVPAFATFVKPISKSERDDRDYRVIRLENGLQAMLIHDAKADKAAASLDVAVGHLHDPVSIRSHHLRRVLMTFDLRTICLVSLTSVSTCCSWYALTHIHRIPT
jgi:hypothetical protein